MWNDLWGMTAEIPNWWCVTTQVWQPSKLKFLVGCHLATSSFGLGRLFYKSSHQFQNFRRHSDQNCRSLEGCLGRASDWLKKVSPTAWPIRSTTQMWLVIRQQYGITAVLSQISFPREASDSTAKCQLFFQVIDWDNLFEPCRIYFPCFD